MTDGVYEVRAVTLQCSFIYCRNKQEDEFPFKKYLHQKTVRMSTTYILYEHTAPFTKLKKKDLINRCVQKGLLTSGKNMI